MYHCTCTWDIWTDHQSLYESVFEALHPLYLIGCAVVNHFLHLLFVITISVMNQFLALNSNPTQHPNQADIQHKLQHNRPWGQNWTLTETNPSKLRREARVSCTCWVQISSSHFYSRRQFLGEWRTVSVRGLLQPDTAGTLNTTPWKKRISPWTLFGICHIFIYLFHQMYGLTLT